MTTRETRREGWYTDPLGQDDLRWWDSQNWTTQVRSARTDRTARVGTPRTTPRPWADDELPVREHTERLDRVGPPQPTALADPSRALESESTARKATPEPAQPEGTDWSQLMLALLGAGDGIVIASAAGIPTLTVDMRDRTYWWDWSLDSFPAHPVDLTVQTVPRAEATMPAAAGRFCEPLLWRVGTASHAMTRFVDPTLRYKLRRWPDLATLQHSTDQLGALKVLANAQLTITELAAITDLDGAGVETLIGALELMSLLDAVKDPAFGR